MNTTDNLDTEISKLQLERDNELAKNIVYQADTFLNSSMSIVEQGQIVNLNFFLVPREGAVHIFSPAMSLVGVPKMSVTEEKALIGRAVRDVASQINAVAIIMISEAYALDSKEITQDDIEFCRRNGVSNHPLSIEIVTVNVSLNCKGQLNEFCSYYQISEESGKKEIGRIFPWTHSRPGLNHSIKSNYNFEAMYLEPLI